MKIVTFIIILFAFSDGLFAQEKSDVRKQNKNKSTVLALSKQKPARSTDNYFGHKNRFENYFTENKLPAHFPVVAANENEKNYLKRVSVWAQSNNSLFKNNSSNSFISELSNLSK